MQTMNQALAGLIQKRIISFDEGLMRSSDQDELRQILSTGPTPSGAQRRSAQT
jgi:Tfp pilus assembly ATPase PilU